MSGFERAVERDRAAVAEELRRALAEGRITRAEYDQRVAVVPTAASYAELAALVADLPTDVPARAAERPRRRVLRAFTLLWLVASVVNFAVWGVIALVDEPPYPWWLWVAGPWGVLLLAARFGRSG
ncbi:hypothetical protein JOF41_005553 [Saccharothrix coeruleofusca]|uniref:DUF1707 SHOCT-like domain-containing protein n=1 Tax=Saccharothrix coeruleofusca TaxID=33919 RepID=UPI001AE57846|nr:DUF1707 domain-containing protein [Saccharothrix coeruleofusca]MBP2339375.1 hypothetical protein [Saccharothrix coeruleofusca]